MTEKKHYLFIRIWFEDGFNYEKEIWTEYDIQFSMDLASPLMKEHGMIEMIIIDTEF